MKMPGDKTELELKEDPPAWIVETRRTVTRDKGGRGKLDQIMKLCSMWEVWALSLGR